jgi:DNA-binding response OmpR family regulator
MCDRCEELQERVAWLESELGIRDDGEKVDRLRRAFRVRPAEIRLLLRLYRAGGHLVTHDQLLDAIPASDHARDRDSNIVRVYVNRLRGGLGQDAILRCYGLGYQLTEVGLARVSAAMEPALARAA